MQILMDRQLRTRLMFKGVILIEPSTLQLPAVRVPKTLLQKPAKRYMTYLIQEVSSKLFQIHLRKFW